MQKIEHTSHAGVKFEPNKKLGYYLVGDNIYYNKIQALSKLKDALPLHDLVKKFQSFNWNCINVKNGHSFKSIIVALKKKNILNKPTAIIINTIKGKGVKEFENNPVWHARQLTGKEMEIGKKRLGL
jgi:transketolase